MFEPIFNFFEALWDAFWSATTGGPHEADDEEGPDV